MSGWECEIDTPYVRPGAGKPIREGPRDVNANEIVHSSWDQE